MGQQLVRACDSIGANLVEGDGRYSDADAAHFFIIARASAREARYWIERATVRQLIRQEVGETQVAALCSATQLLNRLIRYRRSRRQSDRVKEMQAKYVVEAGDPFAPDPDLESVHAEF